VVKDIVERYDLDAIHFDDYFYPYRYLAKNFLMKPVTLNMAMVLAKTTGEEAM
jgi:uncharacterized lipoprotein YddW (UPF0748 family)